MDPAIVPAAGSRPQKQTFDQAPSVRQNQQQKSDIFGASQGPIVQTPMRSTHRPKSDIFGLDHQTQSLTQSRIETRNNKTYQSNIFNVDPSSNNTHTIKEPKQQQQQQSTVQQTTRKGINNDARAKDHGKDFLFGKSDFDEYKSLKRAHTLAEFKPKEEYDPANRRVKELYGNEIGKDHLPTQKVKLEEKKETVKKQQQDLDPSSRKQMENSSQLFGQEKKAVQTKPQEKLTSQTAKWNTSTKVTDNSGKNYDPDTYAKNKKDKELQSSVFGNDQIQSTQDTQPKQKLIPTNQTWQQTDSVKNMKDFDPSQSQIQEVDASQKKMDTFKSSLDTHDYKAKPIQHSEKPSVKQQKYKKDVFTRGGEKMINQDQSTTTKSKQEQLQSQTQESQQFNEQSDMI